MNDTWPRPKSPAAYGRIIEGPDGRHPMSGNAEASSSGDGLVGYTSGGTPAVQDALDRLAMRRTELFDRVSDLEGRLAPALAPVGLLNDSATKAKEIVPERSPLYDRIEQECGYLHQTALRLLTIIERLEI